MNCIRSQRIRLALEVRTFSNRIPLSPSFASVNSQLFEYREYAQARTNPYLTGSLKTALLDGDVVDVEVDRVEGANGRITGGEGEPDRGHRRRIEITRASNERESRLGPSADNQGHELAAVPRKGIHKDLEVVPGTGRKLINEVPKGQGFAGEVSGWVEMKGGLTRLSGAGKDERRQSRMDPRMELRAAQRKRSGCRAHAPRGPSRRERAALETLGRECLDRGDGCGAGVRGAVGGGAAGDRNDGASPHYDRLRIGGWFFVITSVGTDQPRQKKKGQSDEPDPYAGSAPEKPIHENLQDAFERNRIDMSLIIF